MSSSSSSLASAAVLKKKYAYYDEDKPKTILFGDPFASKTDYSKGTFYEARRRFLTGPVTSGVANPLEPPNDFKTKMQVRTSNHLNRSTFQRLDYVRKKDELFDGGLMSKAQTRKQEGIRKLRKKQGAVIIVDNFSSIRREDWTEEFQAGCRMWINHSTGEVIAECPFPQSDNIDVDGANNNNNNSSSSNSTFSSQSFTQQRKAFIEDSKIEGTGAPVYDSAELLDLFRILDSPSKSSTK